MAATATATGSPMKRQDTFSSSARMKRVDTFNKSADPMVFTPFVPSPRGSPRGGAGEAGRRWRPMKMPAELSITRSYRGGEAAKLMKHQDLTSERHSATACDYRATLRERRAARRADSARHKQDRTLAQRLAKVREEARVLQDALEDVTVRLDFLRHRKNYA